MSIVTSAPTTCKSADDTVTIAKPTVASSAVSSSSSTLADWLWSPVLRGPMLGMVWRLSSRGKVARVITGSYEPEQTAAFCKYIKRGDVVFDIGAATGYYTMLSSHLVGETGKVVAFEPEPKNYRTLTSHVRANRLRQVTTLNHALGGEAGKLRFGGGSGSGTSRLCSNGEIEVEVRTLDTVAAELQLRPTHMKIDVEGAELALLLGGKTTIQSAKPILFLSTHPSLTAGVHQNCCQLLQSWGYELLPMLGTSFEQTTELVALPKS